MSDVPEILTARLKLRAHVLEDFESLVKLWAEPSVFRYTVGKPSSRTDAWARLLRYRGHWSVMGYGFWAVEERATGAYVGELGLAEFRREIDPPIEGMAEAGWAFGTAGTGKGYATEALTAALAWADGHLAIPTFCCIVDPANVASLRVAEKCGFLPVRQATLGLSLVTVLERPRA